MHLTRQRLILIVAVVVACVALDQGTKALAQALLPPRTLHLLGDLVRLQLSENVGAFLSLGASLSPTLRFWIFIVASSVMLIGVTFFLLTTPEITTDVVIALACVVGGGVGNLIDRITRHGRVVDFLNFGIGPRFRTGILNVADIFVTFGAVYIIWAALLGEPKDDSTQNPEMGNGSG